MSEYQYYEFLALDRPLTAEQQAEMRQLSTRARITATSFTNEYHWGDFKGDPLKLVRGPYDAHLYYAVWGARRLVLRLPAMAFDGVDLDAYAVVDAADIATHRKYVIWDVSSEGKEEDWEDDESFSLGVLSGLRGEMLAGDLRPLYLAWLAAVGVWERDEDAFDYETDEHTIEPPVPPGLGSLTGPQVALAELLRLDQDLLAEAATTSPPLGRTGPVEYRAWVKDLPDTVKVDALVALLDGDVGTAHAVLLARHRGQLSGVGPGAAHDDEARTIGGLLDQAAKRRAARVEAGAAE
ncbi:hypothetical protein [Promicromonospora umidemergens]|uniref:hypothetical protein n=1 Tax=Promicromonospora umidemergens TaxID=629679 RepID=UPI0020A518F4|nr:hypothetical protein [Promicromonospora umidemergens]